MAVLQMNFLSKSLGFQTSISAVIPSMTVEEHGTRTNELYVPGMKYQVLYLLHGGSGDHEDYVKYSNLVRYAEKYKVCVIMPSGYNHRYSDAWMGPRFLQYVSDELPRVCETFFPISGKREDTFVAGLSMGAMGAMKLAIMKPEKYSVAFCMSGGAWNPDKVGTIKNALISGTPEDMNEMPIPCAEAIWGDLSKFKGSINDTWYQAQVNIDKGKKPLPEFYFGVGEQDPVKEVMDENYAFLTGLGYAVTRYDVVPDLGHEWEYWDLALRKAFEENWFHLKREALRPNL